MNTPTVRCRKCGLMVPIPIDGDVDPTDIRTIDFVMAEIAPRLVEECPDHRSTKGEE